MGFHGAAVGELRAAFEEAVENLETCQKVGKDPQQPFSGKLSLRIEPELHARTAIKAQLAGQSINQFVAEALRSVV